MVVLFIRGEHLGGYEFSHQRLALGFRIAKNNSYKALYLSQWTISGFHPFIHRTVVSYNNLFHVLTILFLIYIPSIFGF